MGRAQIPPGQLAAFMFPETAPSSPMVRLAGSFVLWRSIRMHKTSSLGGFSSLMEKPQHGVLDAPLRHAGHMPGCRFDGMTISQHESGAVTDGHSAGGRVTPLVCSKHDCCGALQGVVQTVSQREGCLSQRAREGFSDENGCLGS